MWLDVAKAVVRNSEYTDTVFNCGRLIKWPRDKLSIMMGMSVWEELQNQSPSWFALEDSLKKTS